MTAPNPTPSGGGMAWWALILIGLILGAAGVWVHLSDQAATAQRHFAELHAADSTLAAQDALALAASRAESARRDSVLAATHDSAAPHHQPPVLLDSALARADLAEGQAKLAVSAAMSLKDTATALIIALAATTNRADLAERDLASIRREASLLASDTTLLRAQVGAAEDRSRILGADRDRWKALADSAAHLKPPQQWKLLGLIPLGCVGGGAALSNSSGAHAGLGIACGVQLWKP